MNKLVIEVVRKEDNTFEVYANVRGKRRRYDIDAPEISRYRASIDWLMSMAQSTNAGSVSFTAS